MFCFYLTGFRHLLSNTFRGLFLQEFKAKFRAFDQISFCKSSQYFSNHFSNQTQLPVNFSPASVRCLIGSQAKFQTFPKVFVSVFQKQFQDFLTVLKFKASLEFRDGAGTPTNDVVPWSTSGDELWSVECSRRRPSLLKTWHLHRCRRTGPAAHASSAHPEAWWTPGAAVRASAPESAAPFSVDSPPCMSTSANRTSRLSDGPTGGRGTGVHHFDFRDVAAINQSINQSKHISIAPYVASESEAHNVQPHISLSVRSHFFRDMLQWLRVTLSWWQIGTVRRQISRWMEPWRGGGRTKQPLIQKVIVSSLLPIDPMINAQSPMPPTHMKNMIPCKTWMIHVSLLCATE